ncbi:MAG: hypothetical protein ABR577_01425 [Pyrinomonadaceae bacterium]
MNSGMQQEFNLASGDTLVVEVAEKGDCLTVSQRIKTKSGFAASKTCTVTCHSTGKSYSWTCPDNKDCVGDCSDPKNPKGSCS